ncbi:Retroviral-like aspartic protease 1 [Holothuria leucospilota]|uniref:Retroviral-like aspartic protease 1 n=1 Tax=Holothuria leucospilota TaxID=206669 RepID=A0A9Q0YMR4_HOLLE|nr:Retroviral-like aspartic protease 1 [Holothuria leucospilota]
MEDFLFLRRPKDLKEVVGLAAEFEANCTARLQRQATAVKDQRGVRSITEKELSKPNFRKTKPGKRQWTEPVGRGEVQGSYIERPAEQVSRELADKRDMGDRDQICVTPSGPTALTEAERKGRNSDVPVVARKHESGAGSPVDSGQGGRDPYGVAPSKPVDAGSPTGGNNMAGCSMVAEEKLEQVDDCCNKSLHSKSNVSGKRAYGKLPQTTPQDTQHETMGRSCKESPGEIGGRPRVGTVRKGRLVSVYLEGAIQGETIKFLVDSGSSMSFLSKKKYLELVPDKDEDLKPTGVPQQLADGSPLEVLGQVELVVKLEGRPLIVEFQVAELDLEGILGLDFLHSHRCQWDWDNCSMLVAGVAVPLIRGMKYDDPIVSKVQAKDNFVVPAGHEMLVF